MSEFKESNGTLSFKPDDTATEFYIDANYNSQALGTIIDLAKVYWGDDIDISLLRIEPEHIHTSCLGHDSYDSSDYTNYLRIEYKP